MYLDQLMEILQGLIEEGKGQLRVEVCNRAGDQSWVENIREHDGVIVIES